MNTKHRFIFPPGAVLAWLLLFTFAADACFGADYIPRLRQRLKDWQAQIPVLRRSAKQAARRIIAGGNLYAAGPQKSFVMEAIGRSGGLMLIRAYSANITLRPKDVVLAASSDSASDPGLIALLKKASQAKSQLILFAGIARDKLPSPGGDFEVLPKDRAPGAGDPVRTDSVSNVIGLWTWTAEFISACVARGKMPCIYQSYWRPGGRKRDAALRGLRFHPQTRVTARDAAHLGERYLAGLDDALKNVWSRDRTDLRRAADLIRQCQKAGHVVRVFYMAHMFPSEMLVSQTPPGFLATTPGGKPDPGDAILALEYQQFPQSLVDATDPRAGACIVTCSAPPPSFFTASPRHVYLNPYWQIDDALLELKGYDIRILPISGIMQSAIYWQLVEMAM